MQRREQRADAQVFLHLPEPLVRELVDGVQSAEVPGKLGLRGPLQIRKVVRDGAAAQRVALRLFLQHSELLASGGTVTVGTQIERGTGPGEQWF